MYIDGEWVDASDGARLESINPATGEIWATAAIAGEVEVNRAVAQISPVARSQLTSRQIGSIGYP